MRQVVLSESPELRGVLAPGSRAVVAFEEHGQRPAVAAAVVANPSRVVHRGVSVAAQGPPRGCAQVAEVKEPGAAATNVSRRTALGTSRRRGPPVWVWQHGPTSAPLVPLSPRVRPSRQWS